MQHHTSQPKRTKASITKTVYFENRSKLQKITLPSAFHTHLTTFWVPLWWKFTKTKDSHETRSTVRINTVKNNAWNASREHEKFEVGIKKECNTAASLLEVKKFAHSCTVSDYRI